MGQINTVTLEGYLARDPYETANGGLLFTIASNKTRRNRDTNEFEDIPRFINSSISFPSDYQKQNLAKGVHVFTTGEISSYAKERDGHKETVMIYEVQKISFGRPPRSEHQAVTQTPPPRQQAPRAQPPRPPQTASQARRPQVAQPPQRPRPGTAVPHNGGAGEFGEFNAAEFEEGYNWQP